MRALIAICATLSALPLSGCASLPCDGALTPINPPVKVGAVQSEGARVTGGRKAARPGVPGRKP